MTNKIYDVLVSRFKEKTSSIPWVFWHRYYSQKQGRVIEGPYQDRKKFMKTLCKKAKVKYFRFHPIRHSGASLMDSINIPMAEIQAILGHENRKTTEGYIHTTQGKAFETMKAFEDARK